MAHSKIKGSYHEHQLLVQKILVEISKNPNIRAWQNHSGVAQSLDGNRIIKYGLNGSSDILGILGPHGQLLAIEVKTGNSQQSEAQKNFQKIIKDRGGLYILARSVLDVTHALAACPHRFRDLEP